ncbi:MAG TPA: tetratricopeptide repeat protein, partial [Longimicrobium sp.]|nr:tetratricopeptide repeat protein [Longimicrobium sp.]
ATTRLESGDFTGAERDYREALRVATLNSNSEMMAGIPGNLAELALRQDKYREAEGLAREAVERSENLGRQELISGNAHRLAQALLHQGDPAAALPYALRATEIATRLRLPDEEVSRALLEDCKDLIHRDEKSG